MLARALGGVQGDGAFYKRVLTLPRGGREAFATVGAFVGVILV